MELTLERSRLSLLAVPIPLEVGVIGSLTSKLTGGKLESKWGVLVSVGDHGSGLPVTGEDTPIKFSLIPKSETSWSVDLDVTRFLTAESCEILWP